MRLQRFGTVVDIGHNEVKFAAVLFYVGTRYKHCGLLRCHFGKIHSKNENSAINIPIDTLIVECFLQQYILNQWSNNHHSGEIAFQYSMGYNSKTLEVFLARLLSKNLYLDSRRYYPNLDIVGVSLSILNTVKVILEPLATIYVKIPPAYCLNTRWQWNKFTGN